MRRIIWVIDQLLRALRLDWIKAFLPKKGYLYTTGWIKSTVSKKPIDRSRKPIPWLTYSFLEFLEPRLKKDMKVFEYGSGNSTLWFSSRVESVNSVEHNQSWHDYIKSSFPGNVKLTLRKYPDENIDFHERAFLPFSRESDYSKYIMETDIVYDIIVVDGIDRNNSIKYALERASNSGVIIVDNLEYEKEFSEGVQYLYENGFKLIPFWGLSPGVHHKTCTGVFYKLNNCLGI
ncbi:FkbM family methyltransferase [Flagellimonas sp. S3867]|uniref:FkbM family methyltransferase n=1 Tax=Flagellimonas sp. S3867 TaxID=2768063 RepID=UPI0016898BD4|nr:FkbM family methyltransferase [Flagellimonas sp. S3867]